MPYASPHNGTHPENPNQHRSDSGAEGGITRAPGPISRPRADMYSPTLARKRTVRYGAACNGVTVGSMPQRRWGVMKRRKRAARSVSRIAGTSALLSAAVIGVNGDAPLAQASAAPASLPLRSAVMSTGANSNLVNRCTHDNPCGNGSNSHNYWAIDLFDYSDNAPVYNVTAGRVQSTGGCGTAARVGANLSGGGTGRLYCHGKSLQVSPNQAVSSGQMLMKVSDSGTTSVHLHYEKRQMSNVSTWGNNFIGSCANRELLWLRDSLPGSYVQLAWEEPSDTFHSNCSW